MVLKKTVAEEDLKKTHQWAEKAAYEVGAKFTKYMIKRNLMGNGQQGAHDRTMKDPSSCRKWLRFEL